jgi:glycyl-tRNA synthetase beta chain
MTDFLLELLSEEIPARMQDKARDDLARLFSGELDKSGLKASEIITYATPRRLALIAKGLPLETEAVSEETKGPKVGAPLQAMEGFLRKTGLTQEQLVERDGVYFAIVEKPGRKTADVLAEAIPSIIRTFPWPKSQRWGAASISTESLRWVRPLQGIVTLLGDDLVECAVEGIASGRETAGHRFMNKPVRPELIEGLSLSSAEEDSASTSSAQTVIISNASNYSKELLEAHVIVDQEERRRIIRDGAEKVASDAGLVLVPDEGLVNENSGLTEWPVPMLGRFDPAFLQVPEEVIQLTARVNQKYFVCQDSAKNSGEAKLANAFICTANIVAHDGGAAIVAGNEKVLAARLSDAKFFWEQDLKIPLDEQAKKLAQITFHEKLGTVADKVERVAKLARWLVEEGIVGTEGTVPSGEAAPRTIPGGKGKSGASNGTVPMQGQFPASVQLADLAERAARLCKADLVTGMVGEFPELQGIMGGYYARAQGEPDAVADAVRDHYKPVGQGDDVPTAPVTVAVSLADKLDTLREFFRIDEKPTGSKDPFALRRAALAIIQLITANTVRFSVGEGEILDFFADRLKVQQREAGVRHDLIDAVFALGGEDDLVRLLARVKALQGFITTDEGVNLLAGYKRAANILKQAIAVEGTIPGGEGKSGASNGTVPMQGQSLTEEQLFTALNTAEPLATSAIEAENFENAMAALASLRAPIDAFFDGVMVNDPDPEKRSFRLGLLQRFRDAVHRVADFSKIEG